MARDLAFRELRATKRARQYLGKVPDAVARCLVDALEALQQKRLRMREHRIRPGLFTAIACEHEITASATPDGTVVVILDIDFLTDETV